MAAALPSPLPSGSIRAQAVRETPYWASIAAGEARMRTGPGRNFPASWLYQRRNLPVKVLEIYPNWRKVQDPDGEIGWMLVNLLSDQRTALVRNGVQTLRTAPESGAPIRWRVEPGVVGKISRCVDGWCAFEVDKRSGYIETRNLWGVDPGEEVE